MAYKMKPVKGILKRFKITKKGKVKRGHAFHSHLMSARSPERRRRSRGTAIMSETLAGNMRRLVGADHLNPKRDRHDREVYLKQRAKEQAAPQA